MTTRHAAYAITVTDRDHERLSGLALGMNGQRSEIVRVLAQELESARIVASGDIPPNVVTMNSRVTVRDEVSGKTRTFTLVYPGEEDISVGNISVMTPVGAALIGLAEGETLAWSTRDGQTKEMTLIKILYQPEVNGRFDL